METTIVSHYGNDGKAILRINPDEKPVAEHEAGQFYKLIILTNGSAMIRIGGRREPVIAPALLCLNEEERLDVEMGSFTARSVYFHPGFINSVFNFDNIRTISAEFQSTDKNDRYWLRPFFERDGAYGGRISLAPVTAKRVLDLFTRIYDEIALKRDGFWPCRSRSFLIELLFLVQKSRSDPNEMDDMMLSDISEEVGKIILYLLLNYREKITIEKLTSEFHLNRTTLSERFSSEVGMSVMAYLGKLRITLASLWLRDTAIPISEIMERAGFKDPAHFNRSFKSLQGCPPSEYRQKNSWLIR